MKTRTEEPGSERANRISRDPEARWALASLSLSMLMSSLDTSIANAGLPALAKAFAASFQAAQWIVLAYLLTITTLIVSVGRLGDRMGRRRLLAMGIAVFTLASLSCGLAPTLSTLILARAIQGLGAATMMALTVAFAGEMAPKNRTGSVMGLLGTMSAVGTTLGPSLGGLLTAALGWRSMFLVNVPLGLLILGLTVRCLPPDPATADGGSSGGLNGVGTTLLALTLGAYALALTVGHGRFGVPNFLLLGLSAAGLAFFLVTERRATFPLVSLTLSRIPALGAGLAMSAMVSTVIMATLVVGPFYLSRALGLKAAPAGLALSVGPMVAALGGVPAGWLVDRFGGSRMTVAGLAGMVLGVTLLTLAPLRLGLPGYLAPIILTTSHYALFQAANNTVVMTSIRPEDRGVISGLLSLSRNLGLITGTSLMGAIFAFASGAPNVAAAGPESLHTGMRATFVVAALVLITALVIASISRAREKNLPSPLNPQGTAWPTPRSPAVQDHRCATSGRDLPGPCPEPTPNGLRPIAPGARSTVP